jgi:hypothetical protein
MPCESHIAVSAGAVLCRGDADPLYVLGCSGRDDARAEMWLMSDVVPEDWRGGMEDERISIVECWGVGGDIFIILLRVDI